MRTSRIIAVALAAGVVGAGAGVTPRVLAANNDDTTPYGPRWSENEDGRQEWMQDRMQGRGGMGQMQGRMGQMQGRGMGPGMMQGRGPGGNGDCPFADGAAHSPRLRPPEFSVALREGVDRVYDLNFNGLEGADKVTYGDVFKRAKVYEIWDRNPRRVRPCFSLLRLGFDRAPASDWAIQRLDGA